MRKPLLWVSMALLFFPVLALAQASTAPHLDANGWTVFTPSADTHIIYVSSSQGNDANDGLSSSTPKQTIAAGVALLRHGYPDWLLLKKGDTWTGDLANNGIFGNNGFTGFQGRSPQEPMLISSYGTGARPLLQGWTSSSDGTSFLTSSPSSPFYYFDNVAVVGLDFYSFKDDPNNPNYDIAYAKRLAGFGIVNPGTWVLLEGNRFRYAPIGIQSFLGTVQLRRNEITDAYGLGLFLINNKNVLLEENLFDHNGWNENPLLNDPRDIFSHNVYGQGTLGADETWVYKGNISANGSDVGLRSRQGGLMDNNLLFGNGWGFDYGAGNVGTGPYPSNSGSPNSIQNNVIMFGANLNGTWQPPGIQVARVLQPVTVTGNLIAHMDPAAVGGGSAIGLGPDSNSVTVSKNVVADWGGAGDTISIINVGTNNTVASDNNVQPGSTLTGFTDPTRTVATYDAQVLGGPGTLSDFLSRARNQSKDTWDPRLTAEAVNDWIRAGYNMPAIGMPYGSGTTPTPTPTPTPPPPAPSPTPTPTTCTENWSCTSWGTCTSSGFQTRTCTDLNHCATNLSVPATVQACTPTPTPSTFSIGTRVKTTANLNVRAKASNGKGIKILCTQPAGSLGTITGGPSNAGGFIWWNINYDTKCDGWSVQTYLTTSLAEATPSTQVASAADALTTLTQLEQQLQDMLTQVQNLITNITH